MKQIKIIIKKKNKKTKQSSTAKRNRTTKNTAFKQADADYEFDARLIVTLWYQYYKITKM